SQMCDEEASPCSRSVDRARPSRATVEPGHSRTASWTPSPVRDRSMTMDASVSVATGVTFASPEQTPGQATRKGDHRVRDDRPVEGLARQPGEAAGPQ